ALTGSGFRGAQGPFFLAVFFRSPFLAGVFFGGFPRRRYGRRQGRSRPGVDCRSRGSLPMKKIGVFLLLVCPGLTRAQTPANDICQNSILIPAGLTTGTTVAATSSIFGTGTCGGLNSLPDVWYRYVATGTGNRLLVSTCPPGTA